jgi:hypothetical protein
MTPVMATSLTPALSRREREKSEVAAVGQPFVLSLSKHVGQFSRAELVEARKLTLKVMHRLHSTIYSRFRPIP